MTQALSKGRDIPVKDIDRISGLLRRLGANEEALARSRWGGFARVAEQESMAGAARAMARRPGDGSLAWTPRAVCGCAPSPDWLRRTRAWTPPSGGC